MTGPRRTVRATSDFFFQLDLQLGDERGPNGEPSVNDFQTYELLAIVEKFAEAWDDLPELIPGRSEYRILIAAGPLVAHYTVTGQLAPDGAIELVDVLISLR